jgi:ribonuclease P protein subunit POP4
MSHTPETLTRHELNGLPVRVADAASADAVGISGRVVLETMQMLHVDDGTRVRQVPKQGTVFEFRLPNDEQPAGDSPATAQTDEAADVRKASGSTSQLGSDTAGVRPGQSGPSAAPHTQESGASQLRGGDATSTRTAPSRERGECKDVVYVTVDGAQLLSRPATRTERAGDSTWH